VHSEGVIEGVDAVRKARSAVSPAAVIGEDNDL
jgi:hypothetical protein